MADKQILIQNAQWILSMDEKIGNLENADLLMEDDKIKEVGTSIVPGENCEIVDATGHLVIPGLINTHQHCSHTLVRNCIPLHHKTTIESLTPLYEILSFSDAEELYLAALGSFSELMKTGTTTSCNHHFIYPKGISGISDAQILAAQEMGIRLHFIRGSLSSGAAEGCPHVPDNLVETKEEIVHDSTRLLTKYHDANRGSMLRVGLGPCAMVYENEEVLKACHEIAESYKVSLHSHLADTREEFLFCKDKHGCSPIAYARELGYISSRNFFAHCIQLTRNDMAILGKNKVGISYCANSDMVFNHETANVCRLLERGASVGIAVDGAASNNSSNMMLELRNAYLIQRFLNKLDHPNAETFLRIATVEAAKVLGRTDIGRLAPGMMADVVMLNWNQLQYAGGKHNPFECIVLSGDARMVNRVYINGELMVLQGVLTRMDESKLGERINKASESLLKKAAFKKTI